MLEIVISSKNPGKIAEVKAYSKKPGKDIKWLTFKDFKDFPDVEETGSSFFENAKIKAKTVAEFTNKLALADDSGLAVDYLDGKPGIYSSRYAGEAATDKDNRDKLLEDMQNAKTSKERTARFVCSLVLWDPEDGLIFNTKGICEGRIGNTGKGSGGFGYDPLFLPEGFKRTMAQLSQEEKNNISHRGRALQAFYSFIENF